MASPTTRQAPTQGWRPSSTHPRCVRRSRGNGARKGAWRRRQAAPQLLRRSLHVNTPMHHPHAPTQPSPPTLPRLLPPSQIGGGRKATQARRQAAAEAVLATGGFDTSITNYQSLLAMAKQQGAVGTGARGACKICGQTGHLTKQCRNVLPGGADGEAGGAGPSIAVPVPPSDNEADDLSFDSSDSSDEEQRRWVGGRVGGAGPGCCASAVGVVRASHAAGVCTRCAVRRARAAARPRCKPCLLPATLQDRERPARAFRTPPVSSRCPHGTLMVPTRASRSPRPPLLCCCACAGRSGGRRRRRSGGARRARRRRRRRAARWVVGGGWLVPNNRTAGESCCLRSGTPGTRAACCCTPPLPGNEPGAPLAAPPCRSTSAAARTRRARRRSGGTAAAAAPAAPAAATRAEGRLRRRPTLHARRAVAGAAHGSAMPLLRSLTLPCCLPFPAAAPILCFTSIHWFAPAPPTLTCSPDPPPRDACPSPTLPPGLPACRCYTKMGDRLTSTVAAVAETAPTCPTTAASSEGYRAVAEAPACPLPHARLYMALLAPPPTNCAPARRGFLPPPPLPPLPPPWPPPPPPPLPPWCAALRFCCAAALVEDLPTRVGRSLGGARGGRRCHIEGSAPRRLMWRPACGDAPSCTALPPALSPR